MHFGVSKGYIQTMFRTFQNGYPRRKVRGGRSFLHFVHFWGLFLILQTRIFIRGLLFEGMKKLKYFVLFTFFVSFFVPTSWAQQDKWPWAFEGGNFQITMNLQDSFSPAIASNGHLYLAVWYEKTQSGFDIFGARITSKGDIIDEEGFSICTAPDDQIFPFVASDGESFFVVWQDRRSGKRWDIYGAMVTSDGEVMELGDPIVTGRSTYDQVAPAISFDGENYLVVWQGKKSAKLWNIYFARVSKDGEILDGSRTLLSPSLRNQASPAVAFDGENYLVVWQDLRNGKFWDIYGARVAPSGEILDAKGFPISPVAKSGSDGWDKWRPVLSWDGNLFLVIWMVSKEDNKWYLAGKWVDRRGIPDIYEAPIPLSKNEDTPNKTYPALLSDGNEYLLVWEEDPEGEPKIFGASILQNYGAVEVSETAQISSPDAQNPSYPGISTMGDEALVLWQAIGDDGYWHIYGQCLKNDLKISQVSSQ